MKCVHWFNKHIFIFYTDLIWDESYNWYVMGLKKNWFVINKSWFRWVTWIGSGILVRTSGLCVWEYGYWVGMVGVRTVQSLLCICQKIMQLAWFVERLFQRGCWALSYMYNWDAYSVYAIHIAIQQITDILNLLRFRLRIMTPYKYEYTSIYEQ